MLVSCLMTTKPERFPLVQRAIVDFSRQTLKDSELVIAVADANYASRLGNWVQSYGGDVDSDRLKIICRTFSQPWMGLLYAQAFSTGEVIASWDDDNLNAPERLESQYEFQDQHPDAITVMERAFYYFMDTEEVFATSFDRPNGKPAELCVQSTFMCLRRHMPPLMPYHQQLFGSILNNTIKGVRRRIAMFVPADILHAVGVHNRNMRGYDVHRAFATSLPRNLNASALLSCETDLKRQLDAFIWNTKTIHVCGSDRQAFDMEVENVHSDKLYPLDETKMITESV